MNQAETKSRMQFESAVDHPPIKPVRSIDTGTASRAAIQTWTGKAIAEQIHGKPLGEAYRHWLYHRATRQPCLRDMYSKSFSAYGDTLLNLKLGDEHVVISQSDSYIRDVGQDLRGTRLRELKFATANSLREIYDQSLATRQPIYARYISSLSDQNVYWETVVLPLAIDERSAPIFTLSFVAMLSEKIDVLQILYDRSPIGIVAAVPVMNGQHGQHKIEDARILTLNTKARDLLRLEPSRYQIHTVGELIRYLGEPLGWTATKTLREGHATRIDYHDPDGNLFAVTIELVNQIVLISLAEQSRLDEEAEQPPEVNIAGRFARMIGLH
ncbi:hypothetical protein BRAS3843_2580027 [Bradyrhizobium sp. STM 3843]|nr:hypothetical protein BRAS3843_2580027 [Bradyrhizobium sp. STM 3843]